MSSIFLRFKNGIGAGDRADTVFFVQDPSPNGFLEVDQLIARLIGVVGVDQVLTQESDLVAYNVDWTGRHRGTGRVVVRPGSTAEVADIVRLCRDARTPIVPQGGNTGLVGGSIPLCGEVVLSTQRFDHIGEVDRLARQVTVGAGVALVDVQRAALDSGLRYPVDFGARESATIGGTIATNAGGISVLRYGMTRRHVVGIEAVLGTGEVLSHLGGLIKDNTGYDLAGLLCGSEGTLGVVTAARLQLVPDHPHRSTALIGFDSIDAAMTAVGWLSASRDDIDALEIFLEAGVLLVREAFDRQVPFIAPCFLLVETSSNEDRTEHLARVFDGLSGVQDVAVATSEAIRAKLWQLRDEHTPAINTLGPPLKFDVTIPVAKLATFVASVQNILGLVDPASTVFFFGHAADGNLHVNVSGAELDSPSITAVEDAVMAEVVRCHGSVSAEHGIGTTKKRFLSMSRSETEIVAMRAIKNALDPDEIMNPNVLFD